MTPAQASPTDQVGIAVLGIGLLDPRSGSQRDGGLESLGADGGRR